MIYFTPKLIALGQSRDPKVLGEQERLWDEAGERYVAYLDSVRASFPPGLRQLDDRYYLHDAAILGMGATERSFQIVLRLDTPPRPMLTLTYDLVGSPATLPAQLSAEMCSHGAEADWLYDEIERVEDEPATWQQSILLDDGTELRLRFRDVEVREHRPFSVLGSREVAAAAR